MEPQQLTANLTDDKGERDDFSRHFRLNFLFSEDLLSNSPEERLFIFLENASSVLSCPLHRST